MVNVMRAALLALIAAGLSGCVSMQLGSLFGDEEKQAVATGSLEGAEAADEPGALGEPEQEALAPGLAGEDVRRSQSALALALDPEGRGVPVNWDNPETGNKGSFRSVGDFFLSGNQLCRRFEADVAVGAQPVAYRGRACRTGPQNWAIVSSKPRE
jgi:surface antigen